MSSMLPLGQRDSPQSLRVNGEERLLFVRKNLYIRGGRGIYKLWCDKQVAVTITSLSDLPQVILSIYPFLLAHREI